MKIQLKNGGIPKQPGQYFAVSSFGVEIVNVVCVPNECNYGIGFSCYLGVMEWGKKNVERYKGSPMIWFSEKIEFETQRS